jgi:SAM-dependent methyltransferase
MDSPDARASRERETYEEGLKRDRYDRVLGHAQALYHKRRIRLAGKWLRPCDGGRALELGATSWADFLDANGVFPAELVCINISERELDKGRELASATRLKPRFAIMDAQRLEFPDQHFDAVFGTAILHHIDLGASLREISRVLKPGGRIAFGEPLDNNPVGWAVRGLTPRARTADEKPLRRADLQRMQEAFQCRFVYEQLLSVPAGLLSRALFRAPDNVVTRLAFRADELLLKAAPALGPMFRRVLILGDKR